MGKIETANFKNFTGESYGSYKLYIDFYNTILFHSSASNTFILEPSLDRHST